MVEPTLNDVLNAIAKVDAKVANLDTKVASLDTKVASLDTKVANLDTKVANLDTKVANFDTKVANLDTKVDTLRVEMKSDLAALEAKVTKRLDRLEKLLTEVDENLTGHMKVHKELEKDIEYLKGRPPRTAARAPRRH